MLKDHKVRPLTKDDIKSVAASARVELLGSLRGPVRAATAIRELLNRSHRGQKLKLEISTVRKIGAPAAVSYAPLKLEIDGKIWTKALFSKDADSNFIAAHELGHIYLHNHDAQPFSGVRKGWVDFDQQSAEWQANTFADYFLIPDEEIFEFIAPAVVSAVCQTPKSAADRRFFQVAELAQCCCEKCLGTNVYRIRSCHFCWSCEACFM
jgi:hypothetical protein